MNLKKFSNLIGDYTGKSIIFKTGSNRLVKIDISTLNTFKISHGKHIKDIGVLTDDLDFKSGNDRLKWRIREVFDVEFVENVWVIDNKNKYLDEGIEA